MNGQICELERRYRRLLAWYPPAYRRSHGEEMIGVLLASTSGNHRRPSLADAIDLAGGGLRIRFRSALAWRPGQASRDALAVFSICMPAIWLISLAALIPAVIARSVPETGLRFQLGIAGIGVAEAAFIAIPLLLGWRGRPRAGAAVALLPAAWTAYVALSVTGYISPCWYACLSLLYAGEAAALVASAGPRRGAARMNFRCWAITIATGLVSPCGKGCTASAANGLCKNTPSRGSRSRP